MGNQPSNSNDGSNDDSMNTGVMDRENFTSSGVHEEQKNNYGAIFQGPSSFLNKGSAVGGTADGRPEKNKQEEKSDDHEGSKLLSEKVTRYFIAPTVFLVLLLFGALSASLVSLDDTLVTDDTSALDDIDSGDTSWMMISMVLVFLMTPGVGFFYGGMVSPLNIISSLMQAYVCIGSVTLIWFICGFSLAFGDSIGGVIGNPATYFLYRNVTLAPNDDFADSIPFILYSLFQLMFAMVTPAQISGALAERFNFQAWLIFVPVWLVLVYCPLAHLIWHPDGLLAQWGILDYAGGVVVHMNSGFAALIGAQVLGRRRLVQVVPANIPLVLLGTALTWGGWFGFNGGSALEAAGLGARSATHALLTTHLAASAAMAAWLLMDFARGLHIGALAACSGAFVGLVTITPAAGYVSGGSAIIIGALGACASNIAMGFLKETERLDDALDVFAANGIGGAVGMVLLSLFAQEELAGFNGLFFGGGLVYFLKVLTVVLIVPVYVSGVTFLILKAIGLCFTLRVNSWEEAIGLDLAHHGHDTHDSLESRKKNFADLERMGLNISDVLSTPSMHPMSRQASHQALDRLRLSQKENLNAKPVDNLLPEIRHSGVSP